jgi:hypothetical protein
MHSNSLGAGSDDNVSLQDDEGMDVLEPEQAGGVAELHGCPSLILTR